MAGQSTPPLLVCSQWGLAVLANGIVWPTGTDHSLISSGAEAHHAESGALLAGMHMGRMGGNFATEPHDTNLTDAFICKAET